jgi:hypothetical protein
MEPGEKSTLLGGIAHPTMHGPVEEISPLNTQAGGGFFASMTGVIRRRLGLRIQPPQKLSPVSAVESLRPVQSYSQSRPDSIVGSEYEMTDGFERTRKNYAKLANRRSVL